MMGDWECRIHILRATYMDGPSISLDHLISSTVELTLKSHIVDNPKFLTKSVFTNKSIYKHFNCLWFQISVSSLCFLRCIFVYSVDDCHKCTPLTGLMCVYKISGIFAPMIFSIYIFCYFHLASIFIHAMQLFTLHFNDFYSFMLCTWLMHFNQLKLSFVWYYFKDYTLYQ